MADGRAKGPGTSKTGGTRIAGGCPPPIEGVHFMKFSWLLLHIALVLFSSIEAGTRPRCIVAMAVDIFDVRERADEKADQHGHRAALFSCSSVGILTIFVDATDIHDADAVGVVTFAMSANLVERPAHLQGAIEPYYVVISDAIEALLSMPFVDIGS